MVRPAPEALNARCVQVVAAAGYGKTEWLRTWLRGRSVSWHAWEIPQPGGHDWVVLDGLPRGRTVELKRFLERACTRSRTVLVSRSPFPATATTDGTRVIGPADLALRAVEVAAVLRQTYGIGEAEVVRGVQRLTAGWPALVHLAGRELANGALGPVATLPARLAAAGGAISEFVQREVLAALRPATLRLLRELAQLELVSVELCRALGIVAQERELELLRHAGLLVPAFTGDRLVPLVAEVVRTRWPSTDLSRVRAAAEWYERMGMAGAAIAAYHRLADHVECARVLAEHGGRAMAGGSAALITEVVRALPQHLRVRELGLLLGDALTVTGRYEEAFAEFSGREAAEAWRIGTLHYLNARPRTAVEVFTGARVQSAEPVDVAMLQASHAIACWLLGEVAECGRLADQALHTALRTGDSAAQATAHIALALHAMLRGDPAANSAHYERAQRLAERANDVVQMARIRTNKSGLLLDEGDFPAALPEALLAAALAESCDATGWLPIALCNAGEALTAVGRIDEAIDYFQYALTLFRGAGDSARMAYVLIGLGEIHHLRGQDELARTAFQNALSLAEPGGDRQAIVPALSGLAMAECGADPAKAGQLADRAIALSTGKRAARALITRGWVAACDGRIEQAVQTADEACELARRHKDIVAVAHALELRAVCAPDPARALTEAISTWQVTGATLRVNRLLVLRGRLPDSGIADRVSARAAAEHLREQAVQEIHALWAGPLSVSIHTLGRFEVHIDGQPLPASAWQSRKARELLRVLVARRGRSISREEIGELLWPGEDPVKVAHRLSVALSVLRTVLDPARRAASDHFIRATPGAIALDISKVAIDVEDFLAESKHALSLKEGARAALITVERRYTGEFLEDAPYDDVAAATKELARAAYMRVLRGLARLTSNAGETDDTIHWLLRILELDPYDEQPHLDLVRELEEAGRHGEARRAHTRYLVAMREIGVQPAQRRLGRHTVQVSGRSHGKGRRQ